MELVSVNLGKTQMDKMKRAMMNKTQPTIRLSPSDYEGNVKLMLSARNYKKLLNHKGKGKGVSLKMTQAEMKANGTKMGGFLTTLLPVLKEVATSEPVKKLGQTLLSSIGDVISGSPGEKEREAMKQKTAETIASNKRMMEDWNKKADEFKAVARKAVVLDKARIQTPEFEQQQMAMKGEGMNLRNLTTVSFDIKSQPMRLNQMNGGLLYAPNQRRRMGCGVSSNVENPVRMTKDKPITKDTEIRTGLNFSTVKEGRWTQAVANANAPTPSSSQMGVMTQKQRMKSSIGGLLFGPNFARGGLLYSANTH